MKFLNKKKYTVLGILILILNLIAQNGIAQANYDEEQVPNYELPEILVSNSGKKITTQEEWTTVRRPELLDIFTKNVYGEVPNANITVNYKVIDHDMQALCGTATRKNIIVTITNGTDSIEINLLIYLPNHVSKPVPVFLGLNFYGNHTLHSDKNIPFTKSYIRNSVKFCIFNNTATNESRGVRSYRWPVERILERGYGLASIYYGDLDPDFDDGFKNGIHPLFYKDGQEKPEPDQWGAISTWAYGLSKAMDYFETDKDINDKQVVVLGHSRLGKAALWAGAQDERFAIVISNNSGCGGAALSRREYGETLSAINNQFPHWFCGNFHQYNNNETLLPIDQHELIGLIAPRPVYVASALGDQWADPKGEFLSLYYAAPAYQLFGLKTIKSDALPETNKPIRIGNMGYHIRSGKHDITRFDWERYLDFADYHFSK